MKKTLLCFFVLLSCNMYSQVSNIEHCFGDTTFDITLQKSLLIGNLNPAETTVSYHESLADATNNTNPITNPTSFVSNITAKTIYARINHLGDISTNYFNLVINEYLRAYSDVISPIFCNNYKATVKIFAFGGKAPYQYSIDNGSIYQASDMFYNLNAGNYNIFVRDNLGCITTDYLSITEPTPLLMNSTVYNIYCKGDNSGAIEVNATGGQIPYSYSLQNNSGAIIVPPKSSNSFTGLLAESYTVMVTDANGCAVLQNGVVITEPIAALSATYTIKNQTITITATGGSGTIQYSISPSLHQFSDSNTFGNLKVDSYDFIVQDSNGCYLLFTDVISPPPPLIDGHNTITVNLKTGQTLENIVVQGENIKWYSSAGTPTTKLKQTNKTAIETPLPLSTLLVHNTIYYASQTINGIESKERLAVTVSLTALSTQDFIFDRFNYSPNPVKNNLKISNTSIIDEVSILSLSGKNIFTKKIQALNPEIDLSNLSNGVYFLKIKSEDQEKTVKIIKE